MSNKQAERYALAIFLSIALLLLVAMALFWRIESLKNKAIFAQTTEKPLVVATTFPVFDLSRALVARELDLRLLLPPGIEAHDYEPKPSDLALLGQADLVIYNSSLEPWVAKLVSNWPEQRKLDIMSLDGVKLLTPDHETASDPHIWLNVDNINLINNALSQRFESLSINKSNLIKNLQAQQVAWLKMDRRWQQILADCPSRQVVYAGHYALGYLSDAYRLDYRAALAASPEAEVTLANLGELIEIIKANSEPVLFFDALTNNELAQTLVDQTGAKLFALSAGDNVTADQLVAGVTLFDIFESNLQNLKEGLKCR
jgi:zinc transport system substrate-binding protein